MPTHSLLLLSFLLLLSPSWKKCRRDTITIETGSACCYGEILCATVAWYKRLKDPLLLICCSSGARGLCGNSTHSCYSTQFLHHAAHLSGCVKRCHCMSAVKHSLKEKTEKTEKTSPANLHDVKIKQEV